ncbi:MAG TPA: hypothetical protein VHT71_02075 [Methylomirabilota bacterium]|jgi:hypothetical protein|nr:hypothetical protein [Methylomirabilota bacterium]
MSQSHAFKVLSLVPGGDRRGRDTRSWLYKDDYPRHIDSYIDFFGTPRSRALVADPCGELILEHQS